MAAVALLRLLTFWALLLGFGAGHLDIIFRFSQQNIEWIEIHLSLLLPVLVSLAFFLGLYPLLILVRYFRGKSLNAADLNLACGLFSLVVLCYPIFLLLAHVLYFGDSQIWINPRADFNAGLTLAYIVMVSLLLHPLRKFLYGRQRRVSESTLAAAVRNYIFLLSIFVVSLSFYDLHALQSYNIPERQQRSERPNVVVITLDTVRAKSLELYGYEKNTAPFLTQLGNTSVVFENAQSVSSWTLPAHASLFTGLYPMHHMAHDAHQKLDSEQQTLAEILSEQGYQTAGFIGGPYCKAKYGLGQGFQTYRDRLDYFEYSFTSDNLSVKRLLDFFSRRLRLLLLKNDGERGAPEINRDVSGWLQSLGPAPFFLFLNYFDAHDPYDRGLEYRQLFTGEQRDDQAINDMVRVVNFYPEKRYIQQEYPDGLLDYMQAMYETEIYYLDKQLAELFKLLAERKLLDNTVIIITSDHGEEFGEHGGLMHKQTLFEESVKVPMLLHFPSRFQSQRVSARVSLVDLLPSILEILGVENDHHLDGRSLVPLMDGRSKSLERPIFAELYARSHLNESSLRAVYQGQHKFISVEPERPRIPTALYDLVTDPAESLNLLSHLPALGQSLKGSLQSFCAGSCGEAGRSDISELGSKEASH